jgi:GWxTD domain-containing protein
MPMKTPCLWLLALIIASPAAAADKRDKEAERWLQEVHLLILPEEEAVFRELKDADDGKEFERIFWARRDPDLATPANEFQAAVSRARVRADERFSTSGRKGSDSGCGHVLVLLGEPKEVEGREIKARFDNATVMREGARRPEVWIYRSRPGDAVEFAGGELRVSFDEECRFAEGGRVLDELQHVARSRIVQPRLAYRKKPDGHLVRLEELLAPKTVDVERLAPTRADFPLAVEPKLLLRTRSGEAYAAGLVRADLSVLRGAVGSPPALLVATVFAQAVDAGGQAAPPVERTVRGPVGADGAFTASYGLPLKPGRYVLRVGLVAGDKAAVTSTPVEVPDYDAPGLKLGSLIVYADQADAGPPDAQSPYSAFAVGSLRLHPRPGNVFSKSESLQAVCVLYGGQADAATGKPSLRARLSFLKDGRPVASGQPETFDTAMAVASVGPVPLATFAPGHYLARVEATDAVSGAIQAQETPFEITP